MPLPTARKLDPTASPLTVYRHLLRTARRHPDAHVAHYFEAYWRTRARRLLGSSAALPSAQVQSRLDRARKILRKMQRAAACVPEDFEWSLKQAYGLTGRARHHLSDPFLSAKVRPIGRPIEPLNPYTVPPTYSPLLVQLLASAVMRDNPIPPALLSVPTTLPPEGRPGSAELYIRPFLTAEREARARWRFADEVLGPGGQGRGGGRIGANEGAWPKMRFPLVVRLINGDSGSGGPEGQGDLPSPTPTTGASSSPSSSSTAATDRLATAMTTTTTTTTPLVDRKLRALGLDWQATFGGGERERLLDWLERLAGKGLERSFRPPKREPVTDGSIDELLKGGRSTTPSATAGSSGPPPSSLALSSSPSKQDSNANLLLSASSSSAEDPLDGLPSQQQQQQQHRHPALPSAAFPRNHHLYYRRLLRHLPILTLSLADLSPSSSASSTTATSSASAASDDDGGGVGGGGDASEEGVTDLPLATRRRGKGWFKPALSHWSEKGPGHFWPVSVDDEGWTSDRRPFGRK